MATAIELSWIASAYGNKKSPVSYRNSQGTEERRTGTALDPGSMRDLMQIVLVVTIDGVEILDYLSLAVVRLSVKLQHTGWGS